MHGIDKNFCELNNAKIQADILINKSISLYSNSVGSLEGLKLSNNAFEKCLDLLLKSNKLLEQRKTYFFIARLYFKMALFEDGFDYNNFVYRDLWDKSSNEKINSALFYVKQARKHLGYYGQNDSSLRGEKNTEEILLWQHLKLLSASISFYLQDFKQSILEFIDLYNAEQPPIQSDKFESLFPFKIDDYSLNLNVYVAIYLLLKEKIIAGDLQSDLVPVPDYYPETNNGRFYVLPGFLDYLFGGEECSDMTVKGNGVGEPFLNSSSRSYRGSFPNTNRSYYNYYFSFTEVLIIYFFHIVDSLKSNDFERNDGDWPIRNFNEKNLMLHKLLGDYYCMQKKYLLAYFSYTAVLEYFEKLYYMKDNIWFNRDDGYKASYIKDFIKNKEIKFPTIKSDIKKTETYQVVINYKSNNDDQLDNLRF